MFLKIGVCDPRAVIVLPEILTDDLNFTQRVHQLRIARPAFAKQIDELQGENNFAN